MANVKWQNVSVWVVRQTTFPSVLIEGTIEGSKICNISVGAFHLKGSITNSKFDIIDAVGSDIYGIHILPRSTFSSNRVLELKTNAFEIDFSTVE